MEINVNADKVVQLTDKLERLNRSAFPVAVRNTLNNAAFEAKKQVPIQAASEFVTRNKSFFRSQTLVNKASGFDIGLMKSVVGINPAKNKVASGLEKQEFGGTIRDRGMIAMDPARVSGSPAKMVKKTNQLSSIKISKSRKKGTGTGYVLIKKGNKGTVFSVKKNGKKQQMTPLYSYLKNRKVNIKKSPFMLPAAQKAQIMMPNFYVKEAEKQIQKYLR